MKKAVIFISCLLVLTGCSFKNDDPSGITSKADLTIYSNNNHKEETINEAMEYLKEYFKDNFYKCTLLNIDYGNLDDISNIESIVSNEHETNEALALTYKFRTSKEAYKELNSDTEYTFYAYMIKDGNDWLVVSIGEKSV